MPVPAASRLRLPLVLPEHELSGARPRGFELCAKRCKAGDASHRVLVFVAETVTLRGLDECLAPSARVQFEPLLGTARSLLAGSASLADVNRARARTRDLASDAERITLQAIRTAVAIEEQSPLDRQAAISVRRYVARGVQHAINSLLMTLDCLTTPSAALSVADEVSGALAFKKVGLGVAPSPELRSAAMQQAEWEVARVAASEQPVMALALQLFHEYLGVHWKNHVDAQRAYFDAFVEWAVE